MVRLHHGVRARGEEGVFGAMSLMPLFFAKLPVGVLGGVLLRRYCPGRGGRRGTARAAAAAKRVRAARTRLRATGGRCGPSSGWSRWRRPS